MKTLTRVLLALALCAAFLPSQALAEKAARTQAAALLDQLNMQKVLDDSMVLSLDAQIKAQPALVPYRETMLEFFHKYMSYESLKPELVAVYEEAFSEQELSEL